MPRCTPSTRPLIPAQLNAVEKQRVEWRRADAGATKSNAKLEHGELNLILSGGSNPALDFDPFAAEDKYPEKPQ